MVSRNSGNWSTYPPRNLVVLVVAWVVTALLLGAVAARFEKLRSWLNIGFGTVAGSFVVLGTMLLLGQKMYAPPAVPHFETTDAMMEYFASEATKWVEKDKGLELDYSLESIRVIENELDQVSKEVDHTNPQQGTFGIAMGYGAYIGEVFRRRIGGSWAVDHPAGGRQSYPLTMQTNVTIFPVGWCWKRLTVGEEDNVYQKAMMFLRTERGITNAAGGDLVTIQKEKKAGLESVANGSQLDSLGN